MKQAIDSSVRSVIEDENAKLDTEIKFVKSQLIKQSNTYLEF